MSIEKEIVISFTKLIVPERVNEDKIILSVQFQQHQLFISKQRILKDHRVNLFRECIFLSNSPKTMSFRIYSITDSGLKIFLDEIKVQQDDISSINFQVTSMKSSNNGFQVSWQAWFFSEDSEDLNSCTDRNYSELDIPFKNEDQQTLIQSSNHSQQGSVDCEILFSELVQLKKRSSEIHSSMFSEIDKQFGKRIRETNMKNCQTLFEHFNKLEPSQKNKTKTQFFSNLIKDISTLILGNRKEK